MAESTPAPPGFRLTLLTAAGLGFTAGALFGAWAGLSAGAFNPHLEGAARGKLYLLFVLIYALLGALGGGLASLPIAAWSDRGQSLLANLVRRLPPLHLVLPALLGAGLAWTMVQGVPPADDTPAAFPAPEFESAPLVLLVIDGADLQVIEPMVEAGELPTFKRLLERSAWGPLATAIPTLSPNLWTTLATGQQPKAHGVRGFVHHRLPWVGEPIYRLPPRTGFKTYLFPKLERLPGGAFLQVPSTSDMRQVPALWEVIGEHLTVGIYRWLVTWPVEPVNGFMVSGGVYAGQSDWHPSARRWLSQRKDEIKASDTFPTDAFDDLDAPPEDRITDRKLRKFQAPEQRESKIDRQSKAFRFILRSLQDPTLHELVALREKFEPHFTAANFYSVDTFQHQFDKDRDKGGPFAPAIEESYRFTDRQLGRFLTTVERGTNVIIVSDHGYDFELYHHFNAPPGVFFGTGPAFRRGHRVEGLALIDIAPLTLHLLGIPLAEDLPGTKRSVYTNALRPPFLKKYLVSQVPTYGSRDAERQSGEELDEDLRKDLESLGYL